MEQIQGRRALHINIHPLAAQFQLAPQVLIDLGTGDGRFVHRAARANPMLLAIGVDACRENMQEYSRRAPANALYLAANVKTLGTELANTATWLTVNFPWGSLLQGLLDDDAIIATVKGLLRPDGRLEIRLNAGALAEAGYAFEAGVQRIDGRLRRAGLSMKLPSWWGSAELRSCPTTWAQRLAFGRDPRAAELQGALTRR